MGELLIAAFPGEEAEAAKKHISSPVHKLVTVLYGVLFPVCTKLFEANPADEYVQKWLSETHDALQKVRAVMAQIKLQHVVYESAAALLDVVECVFDLVVAIGKGAEIVASPNECSQQKSIQLMSSFTSLLSKARALASQDELCRVASDSFRNSPFLASDGKLMMKLKEAVKQELSAVVTPVLRLWRLQGFPRRAHSPPHHCKQRDGNAGVGHQSGGLWEGVPGGAAHS